MDTNFQPLIKRGPRGEYRQHSQDFKRMVIELATQPGASVARVARDYGVNVNHVSRGAGSRRRGSWCQFASFLVNVVHTICGLQKILGHSNAKVTERYAHLSLKTLQGAANSASVAIRGLVRWWIVREVLVAA